MPSERIETNRIISGSVPTDDPLFGALTLQGRLCGNAQECHCCTETIQEALDAVRRETVEECRAALPFPTAEFYREEFDALLDDEETDDGTG